MVNRLLSFGLNARSTLPTTLTCIFLLSSCVQNLQLPPQAETTPSRIDDIIESPSPQSPNPASPNQQVPAPATPPAVTPKPATPSTPAAVTTTATPVPRSKIPSCNEGTINSLDMLEVIYCNRPNPNEEKVSQVIVKWAIAALLYKQNNAASAMLGALANEKLHYPIPRDGTHANVDTGSNIKELYWALPGMLRILEDKKLGLASSISLDNRTLLRKIIEDYVAYRDKIVDAETTSKNIATVSGSDNHDWIQKSVFLLAAQHFKKLDNNKGRNNYGDKQSANAHYLAWNKYIKEKIRFSVKVGLFSEFGSPGYISLSIDALYNLRDLSDDPELVRLANNMITLIFADHLVESVGGGVRGGSKTRVYKNPVGYDGSAETMRQWTHFYLGDPVSSPYKNPDRTIMGAFLSDYTMPVVLKDLAKNKEDVASYSQISRRAGAGLTFVDEATTKVSYQVAAQTNVRRNTFINKKYVVGSFSMLENKALGVRSKTGDNPSDSYLQTFEQDQWMGLVTNNTLSSRVYFVAGPIHSPNYRVYAGLNAIGHRGSMLVKLNKNVRPNNEKLSGFLSSDFAANIVYPSASTHWWIFARNRTDHDAVYIAIKMFGAQSAGQQVISAQAACSDTNYQCSRGKSITFNSNTDASKIVAFETALASEYKSWADFQDTVKANSGSFALKNGWVEYHSLEGPTLAMHPSPTSDSHRPKVDGGLVNLNPTFVFTGTYLYSDSSNNNIVYVRDTQGRTLTLNFN